MCLVVPLRVRTVKNNRCVMETGRKVTSLVKNVRAGDYLICQQNLGVEKISANKAKLIRNALQQGV